MNCKGQELPRARSHSLILIVLLAGLCGCQSANRNQDSADSATQGNVSIRIDFNSRSADKSFELPCYGEASVLSVLEDAQKAGEINFESLGAGETAFIKSIEGVENEGANGDNWVYRVNGKLADRSCGIFSIRPGDKIEWRFGRYP